ncbi:four-carbon acid sugar kinase family protein [Lactobacillus sp. R2/2]|nr:four-carbon acid sugar kinase family protein [Lactobacillus sp. R2/2]
MPALGRQVINKKVLVSGKELRKTEFACDPVKPVLLDNVETILAQSFGVNSVQYYSLKDLRSNKDLDLSKNALALIPKMMRIFAKLFLYFRD